MNKRLLPVLALLCCFVFTVCVFAVIGRHFTDADMASEFVYADLLNREGSLHTQNWTYSSELRVVAPTPVYRFMLSVFPDWHTARTASNSLLLFLVLLCFLYMVFPLRLTAHGLLSACIFSLPIAHIYAYFVTYGGHYCAHLCIIYLLMGMLLRAEQKEGRTRRFALCLLLSLGWTRRSASRYDVRRACGARPPLGVHFPAAREASSVGVLAPAKRPTVLSRDNPRRKRSRPLS